MDAHEILFTVVFISLVLLLLIAGTISTIIISQKKQFKQKMATAEMQLNYEKELRTVESEVQEQVLLNLSRELHDSVGQLLTSLKMQLDHEVISLSDKKGFDPIYDTLITAINQVRMMSRSLNSDYIEQSSLIHLIGIETQRLSQINSFNIHWDHDNVEPKLNKDQKLIAFRIFQEMLNNSLKHSEAANIHIRLSGAEHNFELTVQDDGIGFDVQHYLNNGASGIKNMIKRANVGKLDCEINSDRGTGTLYKIKNIS